MTTTEFPLPFAGITRVTWVMEPDEIRSTVAYLTAGCEGEHHHNFAVEMDGLRIYTTRLGIECITKHLRRRTTPGEGTPVFVRRAGETPQHGLWPSEMDALSLYNTECSRGVAHTPEWDGAMAALQDRFDQAGDGS